MLFRLKEVFMRKQKIFKRAFTLLEILIVLLIIGLIAA
ncbi:MAG TPA: prepilin-type N-terminal cleavage/methylation domain-containing protein, partial [Desulfurobacteriaceae bacterium]|nr:prepilin-type N-terminal cleavage/methylation domain-containing protein [Desulfurobacteriaceae bacterium]